MQNYYPLTADIQLKDNTNMFPKPLKLGWEESNLMVISRGANCIKNIETLNISYLVHFKAD